MPVVNVLGIVASPLPLFPVGRTGATKLAVVVGVGEAEVVVLVLVEVVEVRQNVELPHDTPF